MLIDTLEAIENSARARKGSLNMHVNKVAYVKTIDRVARELGEDVDLLYEIAFKMDAEDGVIRVYGDGANDESTLAFTDFGVETLIELISIHRDQAVRKDP